MLSLVLGTLALAGEPQFSAGSYGQVQVSTDLQGGGGEPLVVASHGPRTQQDPYLELDLGWTQATSSGAIFRALVTPAIAGDLFHYDGVWGGRIAIRNLYAEGEGLLGLPLSVWAGSRMYRGDDLYLLNFWPLDNLNTVGGGLRYAPGRLEVQVHLGVNRLAGDDWQVQEVLVATPADVAGEPVLVLDRQRALASARVAWEAPLGPLTLRARAYGELHHLPAGTRLLDDTFAELLPEALPADAGTLLGVQLSLWGWGDQSYVHLWARRSTGLAATGHLTVPTSGLAPDLRTADARSWMIALQGNTETRHLGLMGGGYLSTSRDADGQDVDFDDRLEVVGVLRPQVYLTDHLAIALEASHQLVRPRGLNPRSGELDTPQLTQLSVMPGFQTARGGFSRPRVQLSYTLSLPNEDARRLYDPLDPRARGAQHRLGIGAEWWIASQRVITP